MKPKAANEHEDGLLEYLEDIIGTSKYKEPIDEALVDMERLQEERSVKMNRLRIVEKDKSALEDEKRKAEDYLRLKNNCVRAASRLWQFYIWKALLTAEKLENQIVRTPSRTFSQSLTSGPRINLKGIWSKKLRRTRMILLISRCFKSISMTTRRRMRLVS
jgi:hypothetical protein